jgi:hypothetical protein
MNRTVRPGKDSDEARARILEAAEEHWGRCLREGHDDADRNYRQTRMLLGQHPDLAGIYNIGGAADGVSRALKEMNRAHDVVFIGYAQFVDRGDDGRGHHPKSAEHDDGLYRYLQQFAGEAEPSCTALRRLAVKSFIVRIFRNSAIDVFDRNGAKVHPACR